MPAKSTITSTRSAGPRRISRRRIGFGISPLSVRDLDHRRAVGELQVVAAEGGDVEQAQAVAAGADPVVGHVGAVDEDRLGDDPVGRRAAVGEGVGQLVVAVEGAVADHQRQVAVAAAAAAAIPRKRRRRSTSRPGPSRRAGRCGRGGGRGTTGTRPVPGARPRSGHRRRFCCRPGSSSRSLPCSRAERPRGMLQKAEIGWRLVRPPGWPSNWVRLWPPWRWIESSPTFSGSWWSKVTRVRWPARRRIVGPGKVPPKVHRRVFGPGKICCSAARIGIRMWSSVRTSGIGSRERKGSAASAGGGSAGQRQRGRRPRPAGAGARPGCRRQGRRGRLGARSGAELRTAQPCR